MKRSIRPEVYLRDIDREPRLTEEDVRALTKAISRGDRDAKDLMIRANLRLVVSVAFRYLNRGLTFDDLISEGNFGLLRAVEKYDLSFGVQFSTYAVKWIESKIRRAIADKGSTIRVPVFMRILARKWYRARDQLSHALGYKPSLSQVADHLGLTDIQKESVEKALYAMGLLRRKVKRRDVQYIDDQSIKLEEIQNGLRNRMKFLSSREREILALRFGLDGGDPMTFEEIGIRFGVTKERIRQIERRAFDRLGATPKDFVKKVNCSKRPDRSKRSVRRKGGPNWDWTSWSTAASRLGVDLQEARKVYDAFLIKFPAPRNHQNGAI